MKKTIIFIHGLGGDSKSSWGNFPNLIKVDNDLSSWDVKYFSYPTCAFQLRCIKEIFKQYATIQDLADSLDTMIRIDYKDYDDIILVGHSMGGLIARKYLLDKKLSPEPLKIKKLLLYAVPHNGSGLANLKKYISWKHFHIKQLCKESDFLDNMNDQWGKAKLSETLDIQCVIGLDDQVVGKDSLKGFCRSVNNQTYSLPAKDHRSIKEPVDENDMVYKIFKEFILKKLSVVNTQIENKSNFAQWKDEIEQNKAYSEYVEDEDREKLKSSIKQQLEFKQGQTIRVVGLSGLGKTRLVYEIFKSSSDLLKDIIYLDIAQSKLDISNEIKKLIRFGYEGSIVLDNCELEIHKQLVNIQNNSSNLNIITLDYNVGDYQYNTIKLERMNNESIKSILEKNGLFSKLGDIDRIVQFADGFPQMAVMLAKARLNLEINIGVLKDEDLVQKMLWGNSPEDTDEKMILQHFSILDKCEFSDGSGEEFKFIVTSMGLDIDKAHRAIVKFIKKGIIDRRGKFIRIVPRPLALALASKWWEETRNEKIVKLITNDLPGILQESLCLQIEKLYLSQEIKQTIAILCKDSEPFGQAEKILTIRGSRLFRSFAVVNPEVITEILVKTLSSMSDEEVNKIDGDIRRNLIWGLEKLCFKKDTFLKATKVLLKLAVSENESWSNNATGEFKALFPVRLSNTEATPLQRFEFIDEYLESDNNKEVVLIVKALDSALETYSFMRSIGAEENGLDKSIEPWYPKTWQEIYDYYNEAIKRLILIMQYNEHFKEYIKQIFANHLRGLFRLRRLNYIESFFDVVIASENSFYQQALESIDDIIEYDIQSEDKEALEVLEKWKRLLSPKKCDDKLRYIISLPPYQHIKGEDGKYIDIQFNHAKEFALTCNVVEIEKYLKNILVGEQRQAYTFGKYIIIRVENKKIFFNQVISNMLEIEEKLNTSFFVGLLDSLKDIDYVLWIKILNEMKSTLLVQYYADFIIRSKPKLEELQELVELIKHGDINILACRGYANGQALNHLEKKELRSFLYEILYVDAQAPWIVLDIAFMYHFSTGDWEDNIQLFKDIVLEIDFTQDLNKCFTDYHDLENVVKKIVQIESNNEFVSTVVNKLFDLIKSDNEQKYIREIKPLFLFLLENYSQILVPMIIEKFKTFTKLQKFRFSLVMKNFNDKHKEKNLFEKFKDNLIEDREFVQFLVATINITRKDENGNHVEFTVLADKIIQKYANDKEMLSTVSSNLNSFSWSGSVIPYYEQLISLMEFYNEHKIQALREWAKIEIEYYEKVIKSEKTRDAEREWGVY